MQKTVSHTLKIVILLRRVKTSKLDIMKYSEVPTRYTTTVTLCAVKDEFREDIQLTAVQEKISTSYCSCKLFVVSCEENHLFGAITSGEFIDDADGWHDGRHYSQKN